MDLSESAQVRKFADDVLVKYKTVDVLVNNAGMGTPSGSGPIEGKPYASSHLPRENQDNNIKCDLVQNNTKMFRMCALPSFSFWHGRIVRKA